jgi:anti-sigma-K factor RskA
MNNLGSTLRDQLAAEFVLGTLHGSSRRRFERLLREDGTLAEMVSAWETRLSGLNNIVKPVTPPQRVWREIEQRIRTQRSQPGASSQSSWWRPIAVTGFALTLFLAFLLINPTQRESVFSADYVTVLQNADGTPIWLVRADLTLARLEVTALSPPSLAPDRSLELWLLPGGDAAPISLGLLPTRDRSVLALTEQTMFTAEATGLAVSLEPKGGSLTGLPTGPVLYQGKFLARQPG